MDFLDCTTAIEHTLRQVLGPDAFSCFPGELQGFEIAFYSLGVKRIKNATLTFPGTVTLTTSLP